MNNFIDFPIENLDLSNYLVEQNQKEKPIYNLIGVAVTITFILFRIIEFFFNFLSKKES